ncbi:DUF6538 domain-containing protein [Bartonella choladocola]|uniref:Phage integrase family protein n=1 Tax=Bartonella choladocola TaxID=2750995 RepID=A0A1U9MJT0_9HYPH|nr:DUF6538 domain-containing protein [Bartonella choladocola]AQT47932.1 Phage integrase family protein [Bartonella choladocola]
MRTNSFKSTGSTRYLALRGRKFYYKRKVPVELKDIDERGPVIRVALKTDELYIARQQRDILEEADNQYWASLMVNGESKIAQHRYSAAQARAKAMGFSYKPYYEIMEEPLRLMTDRVKIAQKEKENVQALDSVLGMVKVPDVTLSDVEKTYFENIAPPIIKAKSPAQKNHWTKERKHTFNLLREEIGNKAIGDITREDALKFYKFIMNKVAPHNGEPTHSASFGRKQLARARGFYADYFKYIGDAERTNPFDGLTFKDTDRKSRPPFPLEWVKEKILVKGALEGMNDEARAILMVAIDTGARLGEIANLPPERIRLDAKVPHIEIAPMDEKGKRREIKTRSSIRQVPLIGLALAALQKHPNGFPRYHDKETHLSNALNKYFKQNELFPSEKHSIYSFRHLFEDRMKEAGVDHELRRILMGHSLKRPEYGSGGSLEWRLQELSKIAIPFDPSII